MTKGRGKPRAMRLPLKECSMKMADLVGAREGKGKKKAVLFSRREGRGKRPLTRGNENLASRKRHIRKRGKPPPSPFSFDFHADKV